MHNISPKLILTLIMTVVLAAACNITNPELPTPTVEILQTDTPSPEPSPTLSPTPQTLPSPTVDEEDTIDIVINTPAPQATQDMPQVEDVLPTDTPGPWEYTIRENDTLGVIVARQPWGYPPFDAGAMAAIVDLNPNVPGVDILPPIGSTILIPQRTATPIPEGIELTQTVDAQIGVDRVGSVVLAEGSQVDCHYVQENETIIGIADRYNTTLEVLSQLNDNLNWGLCQFNVFSGGEGCNVLIVENQCIRVPLPTPTPAPTATLTGLETATPTPTYEPPRLVFPPDGAFAPPGVFDLYWVGSRVLKPDERYLVEFQDTTNGTSWNQITADTSIQIDRNRIPSDGVPHAIQWRVTIVQRDGDGVQIIGGLSDWWTFNWQSR